jgi:hypothetical protein
MLLDLTSKTEIYEGASTRMSITTDRQVSWADRSPSVPDGDATNRTRTPLVRGILAFNRATRPTVSQDFDYQMPGKPTR